MNLSFLRSDKFQGAVSILAAIVMYFTPDEVDKIIEGLLGVFGLTKLVIEKKGED